VVDGQEFAAEWKVFVHGSGLALTGWRCMNLLGSHSQRLQGSSSFLALSRGDCSSCPGPAPPPLVPSQAELKRSGFRPLPASALSTTTPSHAFPFACRFDFLLYNVFTNCSHNYVFPSEFIYSLKTTTIASPATLLFNNLGQTGNTRSLHIECFQDADRKGMMGNYSFGRHSANIASSMDLSPPSPLPSLAR
jgi:hypothetical protein